MPEASVFKDIVPFFLLAYGTILFSGALIVRVFLLTSTFSPTFPFTFCRMMPLATCVVPFPDSVSSLKSLLSQTIVVNADGLIFLGIFISSP